MVSDEEARTMRTDTGVLFIPPDYPTDGEIEACANCGSPAPVRPFLRVNALCQPCYVSVIETSLVSQRELLYLVERLGMEGRRRMGDSYESAW